MGRAKRTNGAEKGKGLPDVEDSAREHVRGVLAAAPAEAHELADEVRSLVFDCLLKAGGEGDAIEAIERLKKMRRAYYSIRDEADVATGAIVPHLYTMRLVFEALARVGTPVDAATQVRVVRNDRYVGPLLSGWNDEELAQIVRAANFGKTVVRVLKTKGYTTTENNIQRLAKRRHSASIEKG